MANKKERFAINPMTGEKIFKTKDIIVYGITDDEFDVVIDSLPNKNMRVVDCSDCFIDILVSPCIVAIINPDCLTEENIKISNEYLNDIQYISEKYIFTKQSDILNSLSKNLKYEVLENDDFEYKLKYVFLEASRAEKKYDAYSDMVAQIIRVLAEIRKNPYITTEKLAKIIERNPRTVQRYILTLNCAGEFIEYDKKKKGWFLRENKSVLWGDY
jgi:predicted transcriptional regulator